MQVGPCAQRVCRTLHDVSQEDGDLGHGDQASCADSGVVVHSGGAVTGCVEVLRMSDDV